MWDMVSIDKYARSWWDEVDTVCVSGHHGKCDIVMVRYGDSMVGHSGLLGRLW